ncbi:hypothetical protein HK103_001006 [Boothiomyces macroporosus]|uniref:Cell division control protein 45 n=1 Tax=Boothiomyces macroporosus TaxID=261099 RepID=A0AAD5UBV5_9FUNG|nr:hypothetical protein HK103_001006 [Boothiomyces macroporosus]
MGFQIKQFFIDVYQELKRKVGKGTVMILVHSDVDSLCALKILVELLKQDLISYQFLPISCYSDLKLEDSYPVIICLNVGIMVNLQEYLQINDSLVYILDSHRPMNLHNLFGGNHIVIIDEEPIEHYNELKEAYETIQYASDDESEENESEESESEENQSEPEEDEKENADRNEESEHPKKKRKSLGDTNNSKKRIKREYKQLINNYYNEGTFYGTPICYLLFELSVQLGRENTNFLCTTNNYIYGKLSTVQYTHYAADLKIQVDRLTIAAESKTDDYSIEFIEEMQLMLLKHWNLYDSLFHSTYVGTRFGIWKEKGRERLVNLLVKMGFPQKESKQFYKEMSVSFKSLLKEKLEEIAPHYNLPDILFPSFQRKYGYITTLSATDTVYSLTALLDCGTSFLDNHSLSGYENLTSSTTNDNLHKYQDTSTMSEGGLVGAGIGTKTVAGEIISEIKQKLESSDLDTRKPWLKNFYLAYDALTSPHIILHGILLSIHYQKILVSTGSSLLLKKRVQTLKHFQFCVLKSGYGDGEQLHLFGKSIPLLYRLSTFIIEAYKEHRQKNLPFVIAALDEQTDTYLVLGREPSRKNLFGLAFIDAANKTGIEITIDFFDSSCIKVGKDDLGTFLENLQLTV